MNPKSYKLSAPRQSAMLWSGLGFLGVAILNFLLFKAGVATFYTMTFAVCFGVAGVIMIPISFGAKTATDARLDITNEQVSKVFGSKTESFMIRDVSLIAYTRFHVRAGAYMYYMTFYSGENQLMQVQLMFWENATELLTDLLSRVPATVPITQDLKDALVNTYNVQVGARPVTTESKLK